MRTEFEDEDTEPLVVEEADDTTTEAALRLMQALMMQSQDLEHAAGNLSNSDDDDDAPVVADVELDLTSSQQPQQPPNVPPFYREHSIDPSTIPTADGPACDEGVSFDQLLRGDMEPVGILELQLVSQTTKLEAGETSHSLGVNQLMLCGRLQSAGEPAEFVGGFALRLLLCDVTGETLTVLVRDPVLAEAEPAEVATEAARRFPLGTAVGIRNFDLIVLEDSFICVLDLGSEMGQIFRLGDAALPPVQLCQIDSQCTLLRKAGSYGAMVKRSVEGARETRAHVQTTLVPLLTNLSVVHLRLGALGTALAYATALSQLLFQATPATGAFVAAHILDRLEYKKGACVALHMATIPEGHDAEPAEVVGIEGLKAYSGINSSSRNVDTDAKLTAGVKAGMTEIAEALAATQEEWLEHGLGDASSIKATAEKAAERHGEEAVARLKEEANKLFAVGSSSAVPVKSAQKLEEAVLKWRAALWLHLDKSREGSAYAAWSIIDTRFRFWGEAAGTIEPPALHYMDLAALAIMRAGHVSVTSLRANVYRGRCQVGDWKDTLTQALDAGLASVDVMA